MTSTNVPSFLREVLTAHELEELGLHDAVRSVNVAPEKQLSFSSFYKLRRTLIVQGVSRGAAVALVVWSQLHPPWMDGFQQLIIICVAVPTVLVCAEVAAVRSALGDQHEATSWTVEACVTSWLQMFVTLLDCAFAIDLWIQGRTVLAATATFVLAVFVFGVPLCLFVYLIFTLFRGPARPLWSVLRFRLPSPSNKRAPQRRQLMSLGLATVQFAVFALVMDLRSVWSRLRRFLCLSLAREARLARAMTPPQPPPESPHQSLLGSKPQTWPLRGALLSDLIKFTRSAQNVPPVELEMGPPRRARADEYEVLEQHSPQTQTTQWKRIVVSDPTDERMAIALRALADDAKVHDLRVAAITNLAAVTNTFAIHEALREKFVAADLQEFCEFLLSLLLFVYLHLSALSLNLMRFHLLMVGMHGISLVGLLGSIVSGVNLFVYVAFDRELLDDILEE